MLFDILNIARFWSEVSYEQIVIVYHLTLQFPQVT
jgi:hypothetical protein